MAVSTFRVAGVLTLATFAIIATICVLDENMVSPYEYVAKSQSSDDDKIGNDLLEAEAKSINDAREARRKGKGMNAVDDMLKGFQTEKDNNEFAQALKDSAPKKDDLEASLSPERLGFVPPTPQLQLIQDDEADWTPKGQAGMQDQIDSVKDDEEAEKLKADGLEGSTVLSAVGMADDENDELVQEWQPAGQSGIAEAIESKKDDDEAAQLKEDGLEGSSLLSAVGMGNDEEDDDSGLNTEDLMLLQVPATDEWVPQGQGGLSDQIRAVAEDQEKDELKQDGLEGASVLSAVGLTHDDEDEEFIQQEDNDWHPKGQQIKQSKTYDEEEETTRTHTPAYDEDMYDGLQPDTTILGAIGLGHHMKPSDEASELGKINPDDIDLSLD